MRKLIVFGALLALAAALIGCGKKKVENRSDGESRSAERKREALERTRELIKSVDVALRMYHIKRGKYPDSLEALTQAPDDDDEPLLKGDYVDSWGNELMYERRGKKQPIIRSAGPDGEMGTDDDLTNQDVVKPRESSARKGRGAMESVIDAVTPWRSVGRKVAGATQALEEEEGDKAKAAVESLDENAIKRLGE